MQLGSDENVSIKHLTRGDRQLLKVDHFSRFVSSDGALVLLQGERLLFSYNSEKHYFFYFCHSSLKKSSGSSAPRSSEVYPKFWIILFFLKVT